MKITLLFCGALLLGTAALAHADNDTRAVQQQLKDEGFFFGNVDGTPGKETTDAIRRYQIRNGLEVSGKLDDATRKALHQEGGDSAPSRSTAEPPPVVTPPTPRPKPDLRTEPEPSTAEEDRAFIRRQTPPPPSASSAQSAPDDAAASAASYARLFRKTPYEIAPPVVQRDTVRRAKGRLAEAGYLRGPVNDLPTRDLVDALRSFQARRDMDASGRLDMDTLSRLHLLPPMERAPRRGAYRGVWLN